MKKAGETRFITWNLAKRTAVCSEVLDYLAELEVDVAILQESRIHEAAEANGWSVVRAAEQPSDCVVMVRTPIRIRRAEPSAVSQLGRYIAHAEVGIGGGSLSVMSVHPLAHTVPRSHLSHLQEIDVQRPSDPRIWWSDLFLYLITHATSGVDAIVGGDWNTSRIFGDSIFDRAAEQGWREALPTDQEQPLRTWFRRDERPHGLDHIFYSVRLRDSVHPAVIDASVADSAGDHVGRGLSDHAPVIMDLATFAD